ncbi:Tim44 domain-containing protein [Devosia sp. CN2-171]|uniref:Tim44 domain-containing protein n=1 Tax=Devosia sp. CN2-171 TaxID=3400909 RepID=UPI003BF7F418
MFASKGFRLSALLATLIMAFSLVAVDTAEARRGGSFGSRGMFTQRSVPSTQVSPKPTAPVQNTMTNGTTQRGTAATATPARPSLFGGIGGAILGGFLFSGLFGMLFGFGFGGFGGLLALLFQVVIIGLIISFFMRRRQPAMAGGPSPNQFRYEAPNAGQNSAGRAAGSAGPRSSASQRAGNRDRIGVTDADLGTFQQRLAELQDAYSREDYAALRVISTPEVMGYLAEELGENASKGLRNEVYDVKLLDGDVAEAWREGATDYATVAMRYESRDITRNRSTGEIVAGDDRVTETTEIWTFMRQNRGQWLVSAIQEA